MSFATEMKEIGRTLTEMGHVAIVPNLLVAPETHGVSRIMSLAELVELKGGVDRFRLTIRFGKKSVRLRMSISKRSNPLMPFSLRIIQRRGLWDMWVRTRSWKLRLLTI